MGASTDQASGEAHFTDRIDARRAAGDLGGSAAERFTIPTLVTRVSKRALPTWVRRPTRSYSRDLGSRMPRFLRRYSLHRSITSLRLSSRSERA